MSKTNSGLIAYAKAQLGKPYWWGTFGQIASGSLYASKKKQYPSYYTAGDFSSQYGRRVHDCIGLIKGYLWSDMPTSTPVYNAAQDKSASGMYAISKTKGVSSTFDYIPGRLIYKGSSPSSINHVGVYIGGGMLIEAKGHAYGVVQGPFNVSEWPYWSQCPYIAVDTNRDTGKAEEKKTQRMNGIDISDIQYGQGMILPDFIAKNKDAIDFVIIKCTRAADSVNASFKPWAEYLHGSGMPWGSYHFLNNDKRKAGPKVEADYYVKHMEPYIGEVVLALDYEGAEYGFAAGEAYALEWLERVRDLTGVSPFIYTSQSRVSKLTDIQRAGFPLWVAAYDNNPKRTAFLVINPIGANLIAPYTSAPIYQYGSKLILPGYAGNLDADAFFGNADDWKRYAQAETKKDYGMVNVNVQMPRLQRGSKGQAVKVWQIIVGANVDGSFGPATEAATKAWQKAHGLVDDGIVGRASWPAGLGSLA